MKRYDPALTLMVLLSLQLSTGSSPPSLPSTLGCQAAEGGTVRCRDVPLGDVAHAFRILSSTNNVGGSGVILSADIADCGIPQLPTGTIKGPLVVIKIVRSKVSSIYPDAFDDQKQTLRTLDLTGNSLTTIPLAVAGLEALRYLILSDNKIAAVEPSSIFRHLRSLRLLDLSGNILGVSSPEEIRKANSDNRPATSSSSVSTQMVKTTRFDLRPATLTLRELNLSRNHLIFVPEILTMGSNVSFPKLESLDLSSNELNLLPEDFKPSINMPKLKRIDFRNNKLKTMTPEQEPFRGKVELSGNPLECDCPLTWLLLTQPPGATCGSPLALKDVPLIRLTASDLCQDGSTEIMVGHDLVSLTSHNSTSVTITWSVQISGLKTEQQKNNDTSMNWRLLFRKIENDPYALLFTGINRTTEQVEAEGLAQSLPGGPVKRAVFVDILSHLTPDTDYVVCLAAVKGTKFLMQRKRCRTVRTLEMKSTTISPTEDVTELSKDVVATSGQIRVTSVERNSIITSLESTPDTVTLTWYIEVKPSAERLISEKNKPENMENKNPIVQKESENTKTNSAASIRAASKSKLRLKEWLISVREFGSFHTHEEKVTEPGDFLNDDTRSIEPYLLIVDPSTGAFRKTVTGLRPGSPHQVCLRDLDSESVGQTEDMIYQLPGEAGLQNGELCKEILTTLEAISDWPLGTSAVLAACASAAGSSLVVALVCFFWCGGCKRRRKEEMEASLTIDRKQNGVKLTRPGSLSTKESFPSSSSKRSSAASTAVSSISDGDRVVASIGGHQVRIKGADEQYRSMPYPTGENRRRWLLLPPDDEDESTMMDPESLTSSNLSPFHPRYSLPTRKNGQSQDGIPRRQSAEDNQPGQSSLWFKTTKVLQKAANMGGESGSASSASTSTGRSSNNVLRMDDGIEYV